VSDTTQRREELKAVWEQARRCTRCPQLAAARQTVVFGSGNADADLMFVGEAPGRSEDEQGRPFVGRAGKLLEQLLGEVGLRREDVFINNTLNCRPPDNRDPHPAEIENCQDYLMRKIELVEPRVVCTLGNFATKLLRGDNAGITKVRGQAEIRVLGRRAVRLLPILHPAAALYTPVNLEKLREDMAQLPQLLALPLPRAHAAEGRGSQPGPDDPPREPLPDSGPGEPPRAVPEPQPPHDEPAPPGDDQLGLF